MDGCIMYIEFHLLAFGWYYIFRIHRVFSIGLASPHRAFLRRYAIVVSLIFTCTLFQILVVVSDCTLGPVVRICDHGDLTFDSLSPARSSYPKPALP